ncbi:MAG: hypothetical protein Q4E86_02785, partial [Lachnospiraceae bacterium]|nr:hypothetical protein [Lachnospiraceae bacterium]
SSGGSGGSSGAASRVINGTASANAKKGVTNDIAGIVTGEGAGYSRWQQDENGWKLIYTDGTSARGAMQVQPDGTQTEQVLWEKVNGAWYAFGVNGYLKSGWVYDYQLGSWYYVSSETGMGYGWYTDPQDGHTYYLDAVLGKLAVGWREIEGRWFYFNETVPFPTWLYDESKGVWFYDASNQNKPFGSLYQKEQTPDGYYVEADGAWDGKEKKASVDS